MSIYVVNALTLGVSTYAGHVRLAFAQIGDTTVSVSATTLDQENTGDDDDSLPIVAKVKTGDLDFNSRRPSAAVRAYLQAESADEMAMEVGTIVRGQAVDVRYPAYFRTVDDEQESRVKLAPGLRGRRWSFQVENVDGEAFDLRGLTVYQQTQKFR